MLIRSVVLASALGFCALAGFAQQDASAAGAQSIPPPFPGTDATQNHEPAAAKGPVRIGPGVIAGQLLTHKSPRYPAEAKARGIEGTVRLHAIIGKDGLVSHLTPVSGPDVLVEAAIDAVKDWVYRPYMLNGEPTDVDTTITVNFNLGGNAPSLDPNVPVRLSAAVVADYRLQKVMPFLPAGINGSGTTVVHVILGKDGHVKEAQIVSGSKATQQAVLDAVRQWTYKPYLWSGQAREVDTMILFSFDSNGDPEL